MEQKKKQKHFDAREFTNRQVEMRARATIKDRGRLNAEFANVNRYKSNEQLLAYVRQEARKLGCIPSRADIIGGHFIAYRFGGWDKVIEAAQLSDLPKAPSRSKKQRLQEEQRIQAKLYKEEKAAQREQRAAERQAKSALAHAQAEERSKRDLEWGEAHKTDSDEALIAYVKSCAAALGHTPFVREVVGGEYIRSRLVSWPVVLMLAELPFPEGMRPPTKRMLAEYEARQKKPE